MKFITLADITASIESMRKRKRSKRAIQTAKSKGSKRNLSDETRAKLKEAGRRGVAARMLKLSPELRAQIAREAAQSKFTKSQPTKTKKPPNAH